MAVAEAKKMDKAENGGGPPEWVSWAPRKLNELSTFFLEVRNELKKVTWPAKKEVYTTTIVVIATTIFFGFYLYGLDIVFSQVFTRLLRQA